jgi:hypothetical protein
VSTEGLDDLGQCLQRPEACVRVQTEARKVIGTPMVDGKDQPLFLPLIRLGARTLVATNKDDVWFFLFGF